jgi:alcohol dehydrogenase class IV
MSFQHVSAELRLYQGRESLDALKRELERGRCQRAVVICGKTISQSPVLKLLQDALGPLLVGVSAAAKEHSPVPNVEQAAAALT